MNSREINCFPDHLEVNLASKALSPSEFPGPLSPPPLQNFQFPLWEGSGYFLEIHNQSHLLVLSNCGRDLQIVSFEANANDLITII